jgi:hypothetical protein
VVARFSPQFILVDCRNRKSESFALALKKRSFDPGLLAEGDLPVAVVLPRQD